MGPKNSAVTHAIVPSKDLSWIDRMYLKLENICVEVDKNPSMLLQETSKYMESHMNVVGANVKKLCTELIQDLISPPILSSEGADKLPECAIHCKCNCMNAEDPKQKGGDMVTKGSYPKTGHGVLSAKEGDKTFKSVNCLKQDTLKGGDMKVERREEKFSMEGQDVNVERSNLNSEVSGKELHLISGIDDGEELTMAGGQKSLATIGEAHESGLSDREVEEQLGLLPKESLGPNREDHDDSIKADGSNFEDDDSRLMREEKCVSAVAFRDENDLAEQASRPKESDCQLLDPVDAKIAEHINMVAQSSAMAGEDMRAQELKVQQQAVDVFSGSCECKPENKLTVCREWLASQAKMQNSLDFKVALVELDAMDAHNIGKQMEREEVKETDEVGGLLRSMYSYVFSELSKSDKEEDSMIMSNFLIEDGVDDEEEQSAHWFDGEVVSNALRTHTCIEKLQQAESCVKDYESDWELV